MAINDPRDIPGLLVWFSAEAETGYADGDAMPQWTDLSGNGNHGIGYGGRAWKPTGGPTGGPRIYVSSYGGFTLPPSVMGSATAGEAHLYLKPKSTGNGGHWALGGSGSTSHYPYGTVVYDDFGSTVRKTTATLPDRNWQRYAAMSKAGEWTSWRNGAQFWTTTSNVVAWSSAPAVGLSNATYALDSICAFVLFDRALTSTERADLDAWMQANPSGGTTGPLTPTINLAGTTPTVTGAFDLTVDTPPPVIDLAGTTPGVTGAFDISVAVPPVDLDLAGTTPAVTGSFSLTQSGVAFLDLAGTTPGVYGSFGITASGPPIEVATDSVNRANGMTLATEWLVEVTPPITEPKRKRGHDYATATSISSPTFVDGRPT